MRRVTTVTLGAGRAVTIHEARVSDLARLLEWLPREDSGAALVAHVVGHIPEAIALLADCLTLPPDETVNDLALSEVIDILRAWWGLHADFFQVALAALGLELATEGAPKSTSSVPSSSTWDTRPPGTGGSDSCESS